MRFCFTRPAALLAALLACAGALPLRASGEGDEIDAGVPWAVARRRHPHHCGEAEAARQDAALSEAMRRDWGHSGCPGGAWWGDVVEGVASGGATACGQRFMDVLDVGGNKGFFAAEAVHALAGAARGTRAAEVLGRSYEALGLGQPCGACRDCELPAGGETSLSEALCGADGAPALRLHSFEPGAGNRQLHAAAIAEVERHANAGRPERAQPHLLQSHGVALHSFRGYAAFPQCPAGSELCSVGGKRMEGLKAREGAPAFSVPVTTVDALVEELALEEVLMLKIDTEGFDPLVLEGAVGALHGQRIASVMFEYHALNHWKATDLANVVERMREAEYTCYLLTRDDTLVLLTRCSHAGEQKWWWGNVLCVRDTERHVHERLLARCKWLDGGV